MAMLAHERKMRKQQRQAERDAAAAAAEGKGQDKGKGKLPAALDLAVLPGPAVRLRYMDAFLTGEEQRYMHAGATAGAVAGWLALPKRKLLLLGGVPHPSGMIAEQLPDWILPCAKRLAPLFGGTVPNQVLVNAYEAGNGIDAHCDGPLFQPVAAIVSLEAAAMMEFRPSASDLVVAAKVLMRSGSLLVFDGEAYNTFTHGVATVAEEELDELVANLEQCTGVTRGQTIVREKRMSFTFRVVKLVAVAADEFQDTDTRLEAERRCVVD